MALDFFCVVENLRKTPFDSVVQCRAEPLLGLFWLFPLIVGASIVAVALLTSISGWHWGGGGEKGVALPFSPSDELLRQPMRIVQSRN